MTSPQQGVKEYGATKRLLDLALAVPIAVLTAPIALAVGAIIKLTDRGPVLYRAQRVGQGGVEFTMFKFRTMVPDAESLGGSSTADGDPRVTEVGRFLRRWKLDEVPQLWNVLRGDMSLVGPRPQVAWDVARYTDAERELLAAKPGITDWASIEFHNEGEILASADDPDEAYDRLIRPRKIRLGLDYVENASLRVDLKILVATAKAIVGGHR